jgi:hypothetical protein
VIGATLSLGAHRTILSYFVAWQSTWRNEMQKEIDKFEKAAARLTHVARQIDADEPDPNAVNIALAEAKRVRRESTLLTRALARLRDQLQP